MGLELIAILAAQDRARVIWSLFGPTVGIAVGAIVLLWGILRIGAWMREENNPETETHEMLSQYREMHENGELTDEEYQSIKGRLIGTRPTENQSKKEENVQTAVVQTEAEPHPVASDDTTENQEA